MLSGWSRANSKDRDVAARRRIGRSHAEFAAAGTPRKQSMAQVLDRPPVVEPALAERIAVLEQQLARTQKLAALGELLSTTTHEFNNVLMTILNYARMGQRHKDEATRDKALEKILASAQRASKITSTILAAA